MSTSVGVETFADTRAVGFIARIQSTCFRWSSTEYTEWNGNGEKRDVPATVSRIFATTGVFLSPSRCPPRPGFAPCAYLISTRRARWTVSSRTPNIPVATCVITWSLYGTSSSGYPPSPVDVNVFHSVAAIARASMIWRETDPNDIPPPYHGIGISIFAPVPRRFSGRDVSIPVRDSGSNRRFVAAGMESRGFNPPAGPPHRDTRPPAPALPP